MKWLIILLVLLIPIVLIAVRYRQQLLMGWQMWQMYKRMKQASKPAEKQIKQRGSDKSEQLIRCERCGTWVAQSEALKLRSKTAYCSTNCMERAAKLQSLVD
jgi:hypothetical protein